MLPYIWLTTHPTEVSTASVQNALLWKIIFTQKLDEGFPLNLSLKYQMKPRDAYPDLSLKFWIKMSCIPRFEFEVLDQNVMHTQFRVWSSGPNQGMHIQNIANVTHEENTAASSAAFHINHCSGQ
jgi:hypothetical protein